MIDRLKKKSYNVRSLDIDSPIINVIDFKQYYGEDLKIIEGVYKSTMFNLMV